MGFAKEIRAAATAGQLVRVERDAIETGWLTGYVVAAGPSYFAREIVDGLQAGRFLRKVQPQVERLMIRRARMHPYLVQHVLKIATQRARLMHLRLKHSQRDTKREVLVMLERIMLEMLLRDRENYAL